MDYIVVDFEWDQPCGEKACARNKNGMRLNNEIIEIGAVRFSDGEPDLFKAMVRPVKKHRINPYVTRVTGITYADLEAGETFPEAIARFTDWCGEDFSLLTWGFDDVPILRQNLEFFYLPENWTQNWFNLQLIFSSQNNFDRRQVSLKDAAEFYGIKAQEKFHDALNDAVYTCDICKRLDIASGIADYSRLMAPSQERTHVPEQNLWRELIVGYKNRRQIMGSRKIRQVKCPHCDNILTPETEWVKQSYERLTCIAACPEHGKFILRVKAIRQQDDSWAAGRIIRPADERSIADTMKLLENAAAKGSPKNKEQLDEGSYGERNTV